MKKIKQTEHEELMATMTKGFEGVYQRFDTDDERSEGMISRLDKIESNIETIKRDVAFMRSNFVNREEFDELLRRVVFLEGRVGTKQGTRKFA